MAGIKFLEDWDNVVWEGRNEIVFRDRNKEYGAYFIRSSYNKTVVRAIIISILFFVFCVSIPFIMTWIENLAPGDRVLKEDKTVELMEAPPIDKDEPPPPPVEPPPPVMETIKFVPPVVTNEPVPEEEIPPTQEELKESNAGVVTQEGSEGVVDLPVETQEVIEEVNETPFVSVEEMPGFPGGEEALQKYMRKNITYPSLEKENNIQGTVYVYFVINKDGKVEDAKVVRGVKGGSGLDAEALRVIKSMPNWSVGKQNGRPVKVQFTYPVKFVLGG
ncbi:MAG: energy transducer TonB [Bacteroidota bacterium]|jgi:protein TonB